MRVIVILAAIAGVIVFALTSREMNGGGGVVKIPASPQILDNFGTSDSQTPESTDAATGATIEKTSVETDAVDPSGFIGVRVRARVNSGRATGARFVAHFSDAQQNHIFSDDSHYSDANRQLASAVFVPESFAPTDVMAFIPYTAFDLKPGRQRVAILPALFDSADHPLVIARPVSFDWDRGDFYVTRAFYDRAESSYRDPQLTVSVRSQRRQSTDVAVIVRFREENGLLYRGRPPYSNEAGELSVTARASVASAKITYASDDIPVRIPADLVPPGTIAEITCYDNQGRAWLTHPIPIRLP